MIQPSQDTIVRQTSTTQMWIENGILYSQVRNYVIINEEDAIENDALRQEMLDGRSIPILVDMRKIRFISEKARRQTKNSADKNNLKVIAILVESQMTKLLGSFALKVNRPKVETKLFTDEKLALQWLESYKD